MERFRPEKLNPFQRLIVAPWFVFAVMIQVALLCAVDVVRMVRDFVATPSEPIGHPSDIAIRLVVLGVFLELRGNFVKHLRGEHVAAEPRQAHLSEACEIYGGYLTVAGLFIELVESTREVLFPGAIANPVGTVSVLVLTVMSLHVMFDFVRGVARGA